MTPILQKEQKITAFLQYIYPLILLIYPLRHIRVGAEWWDTGYNYANFMYMDRMDEMWLFGTYLGNAVGNLLQKLPFGDTMVGMNLYTGLLVSALALAGYIFFVKSIKLPAWIAFLGEFLAISLCWCPTALLYNYLTYLLMGAGYVFLYQALMKEEKKSRIYFVLAGVVLGVNVYTRFSNLAQMALVVAVWAMGIIRREKFSKVVNQTLWCILGYVLGVGSVFGWIAVRYGAGTYVDAIIRLLSMPAEASDYTIASMVIYQLRNYLQNLIWLSYFVVFVLVGVVVYGSFLFVARRLKAAPEAQGCQCGSGRLSRWIKRMAGVGYIGGMLLFLYYMRNQNMFNMKFSTKLSAFQWAVILLTATWIIGLIVIFSKKFAEREKLLCGMNIITIVITPLGSNNHLYASINNLFFVAPFTLWMIWRFLRWMPWEIPAGGFLVKFVKSVSDKISVKSSLGMLSGVRKSDKKKKPKSFGKKIAAFCLRLYPVKAMLVCIIAMIFLQSTLFGWYYVFSEGDGGENLHTNIENSDILKGMLTSPDRAEAISTIVAYVNDNDLKGREVILYGQIPAMSYYLEMPFAITAWPDLRSYNYEIMERDLADLEEQIALGERELPVILLEIRRGSYLLEGEDALAKMGVSEKDINQITADEKLQLLDSFIEKYGYRKTFENTKFIMFQADTERREQE